MWLLHCPQNHYKNVFIWKKDAWWAGDSPGITLETNSQLLFLLFDFWCYHIIIVPGPGTKAISRQKPCPTIYENPNCVELFSYPTISKIPGTCPRREHLSRQKDSIPWMLMGILIYQSTDMGQIEMPRSPFWIISTPLPSYTWWLSHQPGEYEGEGNTYLDRRTRFHGCWWEN